MSACALPHSAFSDGTVCMNGWVCSRPLPDRPEEHIEAGAEYARYSVCSFYGGDTSIREERDLSETVER